MKWKLLQRHRVLDEIFRKSEIQTQTFFLFFGNAHYNQWLTSCPNYVVFSFAAAVFGLQISKSLLLKWRCFSWKWNWGSYWGFLLRWNERGSRKFWTKAVNEWRGFTPRHLSRPVNSVVFHHSLVCSPTLLWLVCCWLLCLWKNLRLLLCWSVLSIQHNILRLCLLHSSPRRVLTCHAPLIWRFAVMG